MFLDFQRFHALEIPWQIYRGRFAQFIHPISLAIIRHRPNADRTRKCHDARNDDRYYRSCRSPIPVPTKGRICQNKAKRRKKQTCDHRQHQHHPYCRRIRRKPEILRRRK